MTLETPRPQPTRLGFFLTYLKIGLVGFGGVNAWARRIIVEEKRWLSDQDYAEVLGLGQALPGPNAMNVAIQLGERFHGGVGAVLGPVGLFAGPLALLAGLATLNDLYGDIPLVQAVLHGTAAAAAGMVIGTAVKMGQKIRPTLPLLAVGLAALVMAGFFRVPLPWILLVLAPFGIMAAHHSLKRA